METKECTIYAMLIIAILTTAGIIINRITLRKGIGLRTIQFACLGVIFPILVVLTLLELLPISTIAVVAGAIIGYAFSLNKTKV